MMVNNTAAPNGDSETEHAGFRILVVDDNEDSADCLSMLLSRRGNQVRTAYDGLSAIELAASFHPEVVLLDIGMPRLNGYETARRIRAEEWGKTMALVALTGWSRDEDIRLAHEAGFDHHLVKPVDPSHLKTILGKLVRKTAS